MLFGGLLRLSVVLGLPFKYRNLFMVLSGRS